MQNYVLTISYDGTRYLGWESHKPNDNTIQGKLEAVLTRMTDQSPEAQTLRLQGASRTDAGVHARGMTASVHMECSMSEPEILAYLNRYLPEDIAVNRIARCSDRFHARLLATGKQYCYSCYTGHAKPVFDRRFVTILPTPPALSSMQRAAEQLVGTHDFRSFCGNPRMKRSCVRTVDTIRLQWDGDFLRFFFHGDGFLPHMIRIMVGTLLEIGWGKRRPEDIPSILNAKNRQAAGFTAPAKGLCLLRVDYH